MYALHTIRRNGFFKFTFRFGIRFLVDKKDVDAVKNKKDSESTSSLLPDTVGINAITSGSLETTKENSSDIKQISPDNKLVLCLDKDKQQNKISETLSKGDLNVKLNEFKSDKLKNTNDVKLVECVNEDGKVYFHFRQISFGKHTLQEEINQNESIMDKARKELIQVGLKLEQDNLTMHLDDGQSIIDKAKSKISELASKCPSSGSNSNKTPPSGGGGKKGGAGDGGDSGKGEKGGGGCVNLAKDPANETGCKCTEAYGSPSTCAGHPIGHKGKHKYAKEVENLINVQIASEISAGYAYLSMSSFFGNTQVSLKGMSQFYWEMYEEEIEHAKLFIDYQNTRGGIVKLSPIKPPEVDADWSCISKALEVSLEMEKIIRDKLVALHELAEKTKDVGLAEFVSGTFMIEQDESIRTFAELLVRAMKFGKCSCTEHLFDEYVLKYYVKNKNKKSK